jgi:hypothetical protein
MMRGRAEAARQAHNLKVIGSNPIPATVIQAPRFGRFWFNKHFLPNNLALQTQFQSASWRLDAALCQDFWL